MSSYYYKVIKEIRFLIMDYSTHKEVMLRLTHLTPVSQVHEDDLNMLIQSFSNVMMELAGDRIDFSVEDLEFFYCDVYSVFMRNAHNHPDASVMEITDMCVEQSKDITLECFYNHLFLG